MNQDEKLDEALKGTFPASDAFYLAPVGTRFAPKIWGEAAGAALAERPHDARVAGKAVGHCCFAC